MPKQAKTEKQPRPDAQIWSMLSLLGSRRMMCCVIDPLADVYWTWEVQGTTFKSSVCKHHDAELGNVLCDHARLAKSINLARYGNQGRVVPA